MVQNKVVSMMQFLWEEPYLMCTHIHTCTSLHLQWYAPNCNILEKEAEGRVDAGWNMLTITLCASLMLNLSTVSMYNSAHALFCICKIKGKKSILEPDDEVHVGKHRN